jgi:excisionase family DNA binding protein
MTDFAINPARTISTVLAFHSAQKPTEPPAISVQVRKRKRKQTCDDYSRLLSTACAARYLGRSDWFVRRLVYAGELPAQRGKHMRFDKRDLDRWIENHKEVVKI